MSGLLERIARRRTRPARPQNGATATGLATDATPTTVAVTLTPDDARAPAAPPPTVPVAAEVSAPPADREDAAHPAAAPHPPLDFRPRGRLRRRARYLRRLRELQLRDLGGLVVELDRFGRDRPELVGAKVAVAADTTNELRSIERALADGRVLRELREAGIGGACPDCGAVHGSADRFCAACGHRLDGHGPDGDP